MRMLRWINLILRTLLALGVGALLLSASSMPPGDQTEQIRYFTRQIEFDYAGWMLNAFSIKLNQLALGTSDYLTADARHQMVVDYLKDVVLIQRGEDQLNQIYANPTIGDPGKASELLRQRLAEVRQRLQKTGPLAESILQGQIADVVARLGLTAGGQPVPPVLYHSTPLPWALIVSPRNVIRQDEDISLLPEVPLEQQIYIENQVDQKLNVSSLVVAIGGVGVYPTMVQQTTDLDWLSEVVSHEWTHNFLTLRPLGASYLNSPALRTMNETTASIAGKEIGEIVIRSYYPELAPAPAAQTPPPPASTQPAKPKPPEFNFNKEMHVTRVEVDRLLAAGKIEEAEKYMEERRIVFWNHGYHSLRKLNQAYFAFYGAYADVAGGGAAGTDPVGAAVRQLRAQSPSLAAFLNTISWMSSFEQLQAAVNAP